MRRLLAIAVLVAACALAAALGQPAQRADAALPLAGKVVAIDPGHNGGNAAHPEIINKLVWAGTFWKPCDTTGTATNSGYAEHAFSWDVAKRVRAILRGWGAKVVFTRPSDTGVGPCITGRARIGNLAHANAAVSIHADGAAAGDRGFHVIRPSYLRGLTDDIYGRSQLLALKLRNAFLARSGMPVSNYQGYRGIIARSDLGGLNRSNVPKVFIECGNMRNATDSRLERSAVWRQRAAVAIAWGIRRYLGA